jgi:hypothetical protein
MSVRFDQPPKFGLGLFVIAWTIYVFGTSSMLAIWSFLFKAGCSHDYLEVLSSAMIWITSLVSVIVGSIGLWRWYNDGVVQKSLKGIAVILMFLLSIPAAIIVLMMLALVIPPMFGIDPKTGQAR